MKKLLPILSVILFLPAIASASTFSHNLTYGTVGTDVSSLQQFLTDEGLYSGPINATYGLQTKTAVAAFQRQEGITPAIGNFGSLTRADVEKILVSHPDWTTTLSNGNYYSNVNGSKVKSPSWSPKVPAGATAQCGDGSYSFSLHHSGTCSHHGGVTNWLN